MVFIMGGLRRGELQPERQLKRQLNARFNTAIKSRLRLETSTRCQAAQNIIPAIKGRSDSPRVSQPKTSTGKPADIRSENVNSSSNIPAINHVGGLETPMDHSRATKSLRPRGSEPGQVWCNSIAAILAILFGAGLWCEGGRGAVGSGRGAVGERGHRLGNVNCR